MRILLSLLLIIQFNCVLAQEGKLTIDLAEFNGKSGTIEKPLQSKKIESILIINKFVGLSYDVTIDVNFALLPSLSLAGAGGASPCANLLNLYNSASTLANTSNNSANEKDLKAALTKMQEEQKKNPCADSSLNNNILDLEQKTTQQFIVNLNVQPNQDITVTIKRGDKVYKMIFKSKQNSRFVLSYGFGFTSKKLEPQKYFLDELGTDSFRITKKDKYDLLDLRFIPTIFFSYFIDSNLNRPFNHSITAGLGFNTQTPVIFFGYNLMWHQNIGISAGICFYEQQKLLGNYKQGQILKQILEESQLYETNLFRPNFFISVNLRLADNPFKSTNASSNSSTNDR